MTVFIDTEDNFYRNLCKNDYTNVYAEGLSIVSVIFVHSTGYQIDKEKLPDAVRRGFTIRISELESSGLIDDMQKIETYDSNVLWVYAPSDLTKVVNTVQMYLEASEVTLTKAKHYVNSLMEFYATVGVATPDHIPTQDTGILFVPASSLIYVKQVKKLTRALYIVKRKNRLQKVIESKIGEKKFGKKLLKAAKKMTVLRKKTGSTARRRDQVSVINNTKKLSYDQKNTGNKDNNDDDNYSDGSDDGGFR